MALCVVGGRNALNPRFGVRGVKDSRFNRDEIDEALEVGNRGHLQKVCDMMN